MRQQQQPTPTAEKLLPQNVEAEAGVLGSLLIDPDAIVEVLDYLCPDDFYREAHRATYAAMVDLHHNGTPADLITLTDELARRGKLEDIGGLSYVSSLANTVPTSANAEYYARIVERTAILRRLIHAAGQIAAVAYNEPESIVALDQAEKLIAAVRASYKTRNAPLVAQEAGELITLNIAPPSWAVPDLFAEGLTILAGKPKKGKSTLALQVLLAIGWGGIALGKIPVAQGEALYLALEDNQRRMQRRLQAMTNYGEQSLPGGVFVFYDWPRLDDGGIDKLDRWMDQHPRTRIIVIDTYKKVKPRQVNKNATLYDSDYEALLPLQTWANKRAVAVVVIAHTRKSSAEDANDEISGSTGLTGVADNLVVMRKTAEFTELHRSGRDYVDDTVWAMRGDIQTLRWTIQGPLMEAKRSEERQRLLDALETLGGWRSSGELADVTRQNRSTVRGLLHRMTDSGDKALLYDSAKKLYSSPSKEDTTHTTDKTYTTDTTGSTGSTEGMRETVKPVDPSLPVDPVDPVSRDARARSTTHYGDDVPGSSRKTAENEKNDDPIPSYSTPDIPNRSMSQCPHRAPGNPHHFTFKTKRDMVKRCEFCGQPEPPRTARGLSVAPTEPHRPSAS
jgi:hypothetical protein